MNSGILSVRIVKVDHRTGSSGNPFATVEAVFLAGKDKDMEVPIRMKAFGAQADKLGALSKSGPWIVVQFEFDGSAGRDKYEGKTFLDHIVRHFDVVAEPWAARAKPAVKQRVEDEGDQLPF